MCVRNIDYNSCGYSMGNQCCAYHHLQDRESSTSSFLKLASKFQEYNVTTTPYLVRIMSVIVFPVVARSHVVAERGQPTPEYPKAKLVSGGQVSN